MVTVHDNVLHILLTCTEGDETAVKEAMDWLQIYKQPQSRVFELWQNSEVPSQIYSFHCRICNDGRHHSKVASLRRP